MLMLTIIKIFRTKIININLQLDIVTGKNQVTANNPPDQQARENINISNKKLIQEERKI